jgi:uncharacterized protein YeaO (DUF488 family)
MLKQSYKKQASKLKGPGVKIYDVSGSNNSPLSPSLDLLDAWRYSGLDWDDFEKRFRKEMENPVSQATMLKILDECNKQVKIGKDEFTEQTIYIICFEKTGHCHRHILMKMFKELAEKEGKVLNIEY